jgi:hypothetical protein
LKGLIIVKISVETMKDRFDEALRACLEGVSFIKMRKIEKEAELRGFRADVLAVLSTPKGIRKLIFEVKNNGQPRFAREAANQLLRYLSDTPRAYGVFFAPYISQKAAEICTAEGIGYMDLSGNCRLCFGDIFIEREGRPNKFSDARYLRSFYSPKATRVLRVLLMQPRKAWKVVELAKEAGVSLGQVSNIKKLLADRELIRIRREGFSLEKPEYLLNEWSERYSFRQNEVRDFYSLSGPGEIESAVAELYRAKAIRYALTGFSGAVRMAPAVRYQKVLAYVDKIPDEFSAKLKFKKVTSGANVSLLLPYDEGVYYGAEEYEGVQIASPIQVYLDLLSFRGRGEEAAASILEEVIKPRW